VQKAKSASSTAPPIRINVYGRRSYVAGVASVASSGQRDPTETSRARRHPREAVGLDVLSDRDGTVSAPSSVLHTPHSRPPDERPHRHPSPVKDGRGSKR
jgi:hypothetical protein